jgi:hypothetical protein
VEPLGDVEHEVGAGCANAEGKVFEGLDEGHLVAALEGGGEGEDGVRGVPLGVEVVGPLSAERRRFFFFSGEKLRPSGPDRRPLRRLGIVGESDSQRLFPSHRPAAGISGRHEVLIVPTGVIIDPIYLESRTFLDIFANGGDHI